MKAKPQIKRTRARRLSRFTLDKCHAEILGRIQRQVDIAESIKWVAAPTGNTMVGAVPMLRVLEIALNEHLRALEQVRDLAELLNTGTVALKQLDAAARAA